jgi:hypothetical protein
VEKRLKSEVGEGDDEILAELFTTGETRESFNGALQSVADFADLLLRVCPARSGSAELSECGRGRRGEEGKEAVVEGTFAEGRDEGREVVGGEEVFRQRSGGRQREGEDLKGETSCEQGIVECA